MTPSVARFRLAPAGDVVTGHAAPAGGTRPCLLRLEADGAPIAIVPAGDYCASAAADGVRLGWCGIALPGLHLAAALADTAQIYCHASGRLLIEVAVAVAVAPSPPPLPSPALTVEALIARSRRRGGCDDPERLLPFARASLRRGGMVALFEAAYATLLGRPPDEAIIAVYRTAPPADPALDLLRAILTSPEYCARQALAVPGPFHPDFAFDLSPLDG